MLLTWHGYGKFKHLPRGMTSDKILCIKWFNIATNLKHDGHERDLALMVYKFFDRRSSDNDVKS